MLRRTLDRNKTTNNRKKKLSEIEKESGRERTNERQRARNKDSSKDRERVDIG